MYAGEISVGYDVSQIEIKVDDSIKVVKATLPEPKIISHTTFDDQFEEYEIESSVWVSTNTQEIMAARQEIKEQKETELMADTDFVKSVRKNAELALKELVSAATGKQYDVAFL